MTTQLLSYRWVSRHGEKWPDGELTLEWQRQAAAKWVELKRQTDRSAAQVTRILSAAQPRVRHTSRIIADELPQGEGDVAIDAMTYNGLLWETFLGDKKDPTSAISLLGKEMAWDAWAGIPPKSQDEVVQAWIDGAYNDRLDQKYRPDVLARKQLLSILKYAKRLEANPNGITDALEKQQEMAVIGIQQFVVTPLLRELCVDSIPEWRTQPWFAEWPTFAWLKENNRLNPQTVEFEDTILLEIHFRGQFITLTLHELEEISRFLKYKIDHRGEHHPEYATFVSSILRRSVEI